MPEPIAAHNEQLAQLFRQGRYRDALPLAEQLCDRAKAELGEDHLDYARALNHLANLRRELAHYAGPEAPYLQALRVKRAALGKDHPEYAASLADLGHLYEALANYPQAESLYNQALAVRRQALGDHPDTARSLNDLATLHNLLGREEEA